MGSGRSAGSRTSSYHVFTDKPYGTHEFYGDGKETDEFFAKNSNFTEMIEGMTWAERDAVQAWSNGF